MAANHNQALYNYSPPGVCWPLNRVKRPCDDDDDDGDENDDDDDDGDENDSDDDKSDGGIYTHWKYISISVHLTKLHKISLQCDT